MQQEQKPHPSNQDPAEGARDIVERELERQPGGDREREGRERAKSGGARPDSAKPPRK